MAAQNDAVMGNLLGTVSNSVVAILVETTEEITEDRFLVFSGTVLACRQDFVYMVTVSEITKHIATATIKVEIPNSDFITLNQNNFHMDEENGIVGIRVANPTPGEDYGFQHLVEIGFNEDDLQDQQKVYTYSIGVDIGDTTDVRMLTPGSIILIENEEGSFDHNSAGYKSTHYGAPVLNEDGLLVGICYKYSGDQAAGYYSAYNAQSIADKIERNQGRNFTSIAVALQHLRQ